MKLLIVEDEPFVAEDLIEKLNLLGYTNINTVDNVQNAIQEIEVNRPMIALVDIELKGNLTGIDLGQVLNEKGIPFIYLSNLQDMDTFERAKKTNPSSNLPKPIGHIQLRNSISLALSQVKKTEEKKYIVISSELKKIKIDPEDILYLKAAGNHCEVHLSNSTKKRYLSSSPLGIVIKKINSPDFHQVHRSFVVNLNKVRAFNGNTIFLQSDPEIEIPISASYIADFKSKFNSL